MTAFTPTDRHQIVDQLARKRVGEGGRKRVGEGGRKRVGEGGRKRVGEGGRAASLDVLWCTVISDD